MTERQPVLLLEGKNDLHAVMHLAKEYFDISDDLLPKPRACGGLENLINEIPTHAKAATHLGIIVDANGSLNDRWNAIRDRMGKLGISLPSKPNQEGTITDGIETDWQVGVWIMPDNSSTGALEDFLHELIPEHQSNLKEHAASSTTTARDLGATFSNIRKATLYTWLAWQEVPGLPYGTAIKSRYFETSSSLSDKFKSWFKDLYLSDEKQP